ncbi:MAG: hypothetical protein ABIH78_03490 [Candidatus Peregrinibacteria bacterium]
MTQEAYFSQAEKNIASLTSEGKYREAYNLCVNYIAKFPKEKRFANLKDKIEDEVKIQNNKVVKEKIAEAKNLLKDKKIREALKLLEPLLAIAPNNETLKRMIIKIQNEYKSSEEKERRNYETQQTERLTKILNQDENRLIDELFLLERNSPGNREVLRITGMFRDKLIDKKIKSMSDLIYSDKYEAIYNFISQLKKIDDKNPHVLALEKLVKTRQHGNQLAEKNEFIYDAETHLMTLMRLKKYDKAIKVASEIMDLDPSNKRIAKILKHAQKKYFKQTKNASIDSILSNLDQLKKNYAADKNKFIRI